MDALSTQKEDFMSGSRLIGSYKALYEQPSSQELRPIKKHRGVSQPLFRLVTLWMKKVTSPSFILFYRATG